MFFVWKLMWLLFKLNVESVESVWSNTCVLPLCIVVDLISVRASDKRVTGEGEYSDSEDEGEGGRKDRANYKPKAKRMKTESEEKKETGDKGKGFILKAGDIKSKELIGKADSKKR